MPEPKTIKNRLHIDVNPAGCDQHDPRRIALPDVHLTSSQSLQPLELLGLADPEGNEFCLLRRRVD